MNVNIQEYLLLNLSSGDFIGLFVGVATVYFPHYIILRLYKYYK